MGVLTPGHVGADLITHKRHVAYSCLSAQFAGCQLFRPSSWSAFGMDKAGQDYRACQQYGPLYK